MNKIFFAQNVQGPPLLDKDGNKYKTVLINNQEWITRNLLTTTYADDSAIPNITNNINWLADTDGAYCWYDNDEGTYGAAYGALYNWYAVDNASGLAYLERNSIQEAGWRVASLDDMDTLDTFLSTNGGNKLKEIGHTHWDSVNAGTNIYGFTAVGSGRRSSSFELIKENCYFWTSTEYSLPIYSHVAYLIHDNPEFFTNTVNLKEYGMAMRLVRDI